MSASLSAVARVGSRLAWFDREKGVYIQEVPTGKIFTKQAQRFAFEVLSYEQCRDYIQRSVDTVRAVNKNAKILITTSPVPRKNPDAVSAKRRCYAAPTEVIINSI